LQYACIAAGWSAQTQALEVDVKFVDSINEVMRLAAPCVDETVVSAFACAAGFNTSSIFVFTEISMLDSMVSQATAGAIRALPYGLFASLVPHDIFFKTIASNVDDSKQYHTLAQQVFTDPSIQLPPLYWPSALSNQAEHATWIAYAAIDAWLSIVPFPYLSQARAVVNLHSPSSFVPSVSNAIGRNGRICTLAALYLDQSLHCIKTEDYPQFVAAAWLFVDYAAICLFSARTFGFEHPSRSRIEANFKETLWKVMQIDRSPLPQMSGCDKYAKATVKCMCIINTIGAGTLPRMASASQIYTAKFLAGGFIRAWSSLILKRTSQNGVVSKQAFVIAARMVVSLVALQVSQPTTQSKFAA